MQKGELDRVADGIATVQRRRNRAGLIERIVCANLHAFRMGSNAERVQLITVDESARWWVFSPACRLQTRTLAGREPVRLGQVRPTRIGDLRIGEGIDHGR